MSVGVILLCHTGLERVAEVARFWARHNVPVVIHVDMRVSQTAFDGLAAALGPCDRVWLIRRHACDWGKWPIVAATLDCAEDLLRRAPDVTHVCLTSGSCLPLQPVAALNTFLADHPDSDFIETVPLRVSSWIVGGLGMERFTLRFPFGWKTHRKLFDRYVELQRKLPFRRTIPAELDPRLGSQWWCLTRATLLAVLNDPRRAEFDRYFRHVWIPDESYFQTLVPRHSVRLVSQSLTLSRFDALGKPHVFYDDYKDLLAASGMFFARKIWAGADDLYRVFLGQPAVVTGAVSTQDLDQRVDAARQRAVDGRPGLLMQSRFPKRRVETAKTAAPYAVLQGFDALFEDFQSWFEGGFDGLAHGHVFAPDRVHYAGAAHGFTGGLTDNARLRDYDPRSFLRNMLWNGRARRQSFLFSVADRQAIWPELVTDPHAHIAVIRDAWALPLLRSGRERAVLLRAARWLRRRELLQLNALSAPSARAASRIWTLADLRRDPVAVLRDAGAFLNARSAPYMPPWPQLADQTGLDDFLRDVDSHTQTPLPAPPRRPTIRLPLFIKK